MVLRRRMPAAACATLLALSLAACTPTSSTPSPTPTPSRTALFSSDAEALKAATDAYAAYLKVSDMISHDGGANPERIKPYVTEGVFVSLRSDFAELEKSGHHTDGASRFRDVRLSRFSSSGISVYLCSDVSSVRVLDASGVDVTPTARQDVLPLSVEFSVSDGFLRLAQSKVWSGRSFC